MGTVVRLLRSGPVRWGFLAVAVGFAAWAVWRDREPVGDALGRLGPAVAVLAVVLTFLHVVAAGAGWRTVLADLGSRLGVRAAARMFLVGQLARYVPGSVWQVVALTEAGTEHAIPRRRTAGASLVALGVSVAVGASVVVATLPTTRSLGLSPWLAVLAPLPLLVLHPRLLGPLLAGVVRLARRAPLERLVSGPGVLRAVAWALAAWCLLGAQVYVLAVGLGAPSGLRTAALCLGGFVLAWIAGFVVVVAPAGAGVREVVLAAMLDGLLDTGAVILVVIMSRVLLTGVEFLSAAGVFGETLRRSPRPEPRQQGVDQG